MTNKRLISCNGKKPNMKWGDKSLLIEVGEDDKYKSLAYVPPAGIVIVDCDSEESMKQVEESNTALGLTPFNYPTDKGRHYVFKLDPDSKVQSTFGSTNGATIFDKVDIKGNNKGYVIIKHNNKVRVDSLELFDAFEDVDNIPTLPMIYSVKKSLRNSGINLETYGKDGQDDTMFGWVAKLRSKKWTKDEFLQFAQEITLVNGDKYSPEETKKWAIEKWASSVNMGNVDDFLTDDDSLASKVMKCFAYKTYVKSSKETAEEVVDSFIAIDVKSYSRIYEHIISALKLSYNKDDKQIWGLVDGEMSVVLNLELEITKFIYRFFRDIQPAVISKISKGIVGALPIVKTNTNAFVVTFANRTYDVFKGKDVELPANVIQQNRIPIRLLSTDEIKLTHSEESKFLDNMMQGWTMGDKDLEKELYEMGGLSISRHTIDKAYFLLGDASNGKSWFLNWLQAIIGKTNISNIDLKAISSDQFASSGLYGKLANINNDMSSSIINDPSLFKRLVSGDTISSQFKNKDRFNFEPYATQIYGANKVPHVKEGGDSTAIERRLKILPFKNKFKETNKKIEMKNKLMTMKSLEVGLYRFVVALNEALHSEFTDSKASEEVKEQYLTDNNHMITFVQESKIKDDETLVSVYSNYRNWCKTYNIREVGIVEFRLRYIKACKFWGIPIFIEELDGVENTGRRLIKIDQE